MNTRTCAEGVDEFTGGPALAARRGALDSLRGPEGGYARSHRGLAAFWRVIAEEVLVRPTPPETLSLLTQLDDWLAGGPACALAVSADPRARTALLARWAISIVEREAAEVIFVPVSPCFGTAVERDMLKLFFGLFRSSTTAVFSRPRSPEELMLSIRMALRSVDSVSSVPSEECPQLLVIVDGLERAADGWPHRRMPFLGDVYDGAHIIVSTSPESSSAHGLGLHERLAWSREQTSLFFLAREIDTSEKSTQAREVIERAGEVEPSLIRFFDALGTALAPVSNDDLVSAIGLDGTALEAFKNGPLSAHEPLVVSDNEKYSFRDDATRASWMVDANKVASVEDAIIGRGLAALTRGAVVPDAWSPYLVEYLGAHMQRRSVSVPELMRLVSPEWLQIWMSRPGGLVGFTTDARRARYAAEDALASACSPECAGVAQQDRATLLCAIVRCALVEGSLFAKEGSHEQSDYRTGPYVESSVDLSRPTGAARERAEALMTLASVLTGSEQQLVQRWAADACAGLGEVFPRPIPYVATDQSAADPERVRRIRAGAKHEEVDGYLARDLVIRPTDLSPEEAWSLAESRDGESRMVAFAGILPDLPDEMREKAVREVIAAYWAHGDRLALRILAACAPWMSLADAAKVLCNELGNDWTDEYPGMLVGFGSLTELSPLVRRLGGTAALVGVARAIADVGRWLP
ncbi:hypothetical protein BE20_39050 [Sorangium cellulosum]|uniref:Uncharacterized protein n=1 Tax=Sorangium cellulosum TaxID=56 RepID=A0A150T892_SORCE|nr:hypothetical protein BE20_39050 [Sorangium cellulosum]KYG00891.1 hypothetical protein BE18_27780 [Sorangium cellulosum]